MEQEKIISMLADKWDSFYLYDEKGILQSTSYLKSYFPQVHFLYSIKCNPNPNVLHCVFEQGFGADAASIGEVLLAKDAGLPANQIYYSAPGKSRGDIENSIGKAVLIADSVNEILRIQAVAQQMGEVVSIGIRINPDFTFSGDGGKASKFGIDEKQALAFAEKNPCKNIKITGIHVHVKSQELNAATLAAYYERMFQLAEKFMRISGPLEYVNLGSGMGIPYAMSDAPLDIPMLSGAVQNRFDEFRAAHPSTKILIEVGRYAVCKSGLYVTKVMDKKTSHGTTYLILKNTLNGFIRPSLAKLVEHYAVEESPASSEPLFTARDAFQFLTLKDEAPSETVTLVGNLCTATDVIAENIPMPHLECGDTVIITNAGGYAAVLSPLQFSSQERPAELFLTQSGEVI